MIDKLMQYPWVLYSIGICILLLIIVIILIIITKNDGSELCASDAEQNRIINDFLKEEKKRMKKQNTFVSEDCEEDNIDVNSQNFDSESEIVQSFEEEIEEDDEDMILKNKKKTIVTKRTIVVPKKTVETPTAEKRVLNGKYEMFSQNDLYKYLLKASNGEILVESEEYSSKDSVIGAIEAVKRNLETGKVSISKDKRDLYQFKLTASNNRSLVVSANYTSKQNAEKALESFKRFALNSPIVEVEAPKDAFGEEIVVEKADLKLNGKLVISAEGKGYLFKLFANNGELLCTSQPYSTKSNCENGVDTLKDAVNEGNFLVYKDKSSYYQFKLYSKSHRLIAIGQTYEDKQRAISSANSVASFIDDAEIVK